MGKSRLLNEFRQRVSGQGIRYAEGQCLAYGSGTPYLPVVDLLRAHCEIAADDSPETRLTKVCTSLQRASLDPIPAYLFSCPCWACRSGRSARVAQRRGTKGTDF